MTVCTKDDTCRYTFYNATSGYPYLNRSSNYCVAKCKYYYYWYN